MTVDASPWTLPGAGRLHLVQVPLPLLHALGNGDAELSSELLTPYVVGEECRGLWHYRSRQITTNPSDHPWITRIAVDTATGEPVGIAGFHGPPDSRGMVEVGYQIDPAQRRRGYAREALEVLLALAHREPNVQVLRATIGPDNVPSLNLIRHYAFREVGEQWDDEDGVEIIFEADTTHPASG